MGKRKKMGWRNFDRKIGREKKSEKRRVIEKQGERDKRHRNKQNPLRHKK
jgi:hypothetical protein